MGCLGRTYLLETIPRSTDTDVFSCVFSIVIHECSGISVSAFTWQSAPTAHQHYHSINGESSSVPGYTRGICHHEDTRGRTVWQIYNTEVGLDSFILCAPREWLLLASSRGLSGFVRCSFWTGVWFMCSQSRAVLIFFVCFSLSVLNRIVWKRLTWRGRTKLIPSRNKSSNWSWRRWVMGLSLLSHLFFLHGFRCIYTVGKDSLNFFESLYVAFSYICTYQFFLHLCLC